MPSEAFDLFQAQRRVLRSRLPGIQQLVLLQLCDYWSKDRPKPFPSLNLLARRCDVDRKTIMVALAALRAAGVLGVIEGGRGRGNAYDLAGLMALVQHTDQFDKRTSTPAPPVPPTDRSDKGTTTGPVGGPQVVRPADPIDPSDCSNGIGASLPRGDATAGMAPTRPRSSSKKGKAEPERSGREKIVDAYFVGYRGQHGTDPIFGALDGKAVNTLFDKCKGDVEKACGVVENAFLSFRRSTVSIQAIAKDPSAFHPEAPKRGQRPVQATTPELDGLGKGHRLSGGNVVPLPKAAGGGT